MTQPVDLDELERLLAAVKDAGDAFIDNPHSRGAEYEHRNARGKLADCLVTAYPAMAAELRRLRAMVKWLPQTRDGVLIYFCEQLFCPDCASELARDFNGKPTSSLRCKNQACVIKNNRVYSPTDCYSTKEAAEQSKKEKNNG